MRSRKNKSGNPTPHEEIVVRVCILGSMVHCLSCGLVMVLKFTPNYAPEGLRVVDGVMTATCLNLRCKRFNIAYDLPSVEIEAHCL